MARAVQVAPLHHPADGFYTWTAEGNAKQPYRIEQADGEPMSFTDVWGHKETMGVHHSSRRMCYRGGHP